MYRIAAVEATESEIERQEPRPTRRAKRIEKRKEIRDKTDAPKIWGTDLINNS